MSNNKPISKDNVRWFHFSSNPLLCGKAFVILDEKIGSGKKIRLKLLTLKELNPSRIGTVKPMSDNEYRALVSQFFGMDEDGMFTMDGRDIALCYTYDDVMDKDPNFYRFERVDFGDSEDELPDPKTCPHQGEHNAFCSKCGAKLKK